MSKGFSIIRNGLFLGLCMLMLTGCALVKPERHYDEATPIDWGLENSFESSITVMPFEAQDEKWGIYAAKQLQQHLLESRAFRRVVYSSAEPAGTQFVLKGNLEYIYYGGYSAGHKVGDRQVGLALLRRDGFVSRDAGAERGLLRTPPLLAAGRALTCLAKRSMCAWAAGAGSSRSRSRISSSAVRSSGLLRFTLPLAVMPSKL